MISRLATLITIAVVFTVLAVFWFLTEFRQNESPPYDPEQGDRAIIDPIELQSRKSTRYAPSSTYTQSEGEDDRGFLSVLQGPPPQATLAGPRAAIPQRPVSAREVVHDGVGLHPHMQQGPSAVEPSFTSILQRSPLPEAERPSRPRRDQDDLRLPDGLTLVDRDSDRDLWICEDEHGRRWEARTKYGHYTLSE